jgi:hypothetical protein
MLGHFDESRIPAQAERRDVMRGLEGVYLKLSVGCVHSLLNKGTKPVRWK